MAQLCSKKWRNSSLAKKKVLQDWLLAPYYILFLLTSTLCRSYFNFQLKYNLCNFQAKIVCTQLGSPGGKLLSPAPTTTNVNWLFTNTGTISTCTGVNDIAGCDADKTSAGTCSALTEAFAVECEKLAKPPTGKF